MMPILQKSQYNDAFNTGNVSQGANDKAYRLDQNNGDYVKTEDCNNTYIVINTDYVEDYAQEHVRKKEFSIEDARDYERTKLGVHEEAHTRQKTYNAYRSVCNPKTGKYIDTRGNPKHKIDYDKRKEEKQAYDAEHFAD